LRNKKVVIITEAQCNPPIGPGARRVRCFAKALKNSGWNVQIWTMIFISRPHKKAIIIEDGITYRYLTLYIPGMNIGNSLAGIFKIFNFIYFIFQAIINLFLLKINITIMYSKHWPVIWVLGLFLKKSNIPLIHEISEWPPEIPHLKRTLRLFYENRLFRLIDGAIVISEFIEQKVVLWNKINQKHLIHSIKIPILFELNKSQITIKKECFNSNSHFFWCGDLEGYISLVFFLLDALSIACKNDNRIYKISLCGKLKTSIKSKLLLYAKSISLSEDQLLLRGFISDDNLYHEMVNSYALLAPLHNDKRSEARFPTKIAEYLITAKPVIATGIGEINTYLYDGINAYISKPDDKNSFAERMSTVINNPDSALLVGKNGRETALKYFNYQYYSTVIDQFCTSLIEHKIKPS
jgi:glycosyltransferase involved in cell wall biosynthesis